LKYFEVNCRQVPTKLLLTHAVVFINPLGFNDSTSRGTSIKKGIFHGEQMPSFIDESISKREL
jgi:hypothetical protein